MGYGWRRVERSLRGQAREGRAKGCKLSQDVACWQGRVEGGGSKAEFRVGLGSTGLLLYLNYLMF